MLLYVSIIVDQGAIVLLSTLYCPLFHVKHVGFIGQACNIWLEGRDPQLSWDSAHEVHEPREVLAIQFCGRVVQQEG